MPASATSVPHRSVLRRWMRAVGWCVLVAAGLSFALLAGRWTWQAVMATEGDVPSVEQMRFPAGSEVLRSERQCGSGGCTAIFEVRPPPGLTASQMSAQYTQLHDGRIPGSLFDLRSISFVADADADAVHVAASLWSSSPALPARS